jgi:hypothetical protein
MPLLAAWLGNLFASLVAFFASIVSRRIAIFAAVVIALQATISAFVLSIKGLISGIAYAAPAWISQAWQWFVPSNLDECLGIVIAAKTVAWVYSWNIKIIQYKLGV